MEKLFEYYLENENFHLKYAKCEPSLKEREFHKYHELIYFLNGDAYFISKNIQQQLQPDCIVLIPKEEFHQFFINNPTTYTRCIIGFYETSETQNLIREVFNEVKIINIPSKKIKGIFENIIEIVQSNISDEEKQLFALSSLIHLLIYFKQYSTAQITYHIDISPIVQQALSYIDKNYTQKISVADIANALYVSPSTITHKFKKELNISVYQYISKKRVISVQQLVKKGESYSEAAVKCGFSDYSGFYRIYKKYY